MCYSGHCGIHEFYLGIRTFATAHSRGRLHANVMDSGSDGKSASFRVLLPVDSGQDLGSRSGHLLVLDHVGDRMAIVRVQEAKTSAPRTVCGCGEPEFLNVHFCVDLKRWTRQSSMVCFTAT